MAYVAGAIPVTTLLDANMRQLPSSAKMHSISMADNVSSARMFNKMIEVFLEIAVGIDPKTKRSFKEGGLFGRARGYYGLTESQSSGALHCHILIWLIGFPKTIQQTTELLQDKEMGHVFKQRLCDFSDSISTTTLPIPVNVSSCTNCGQESPAFEPIAIPLSAQKTPFRKNNIVPTEPALHQCSKCNAGASSQHLIRRALLAARPKVWPPPLEPLTAEELAKRIAIEQRARAGHTNVEELVSDRENLYMQYRSFLEVTDGKFQDDDELQFDLRLHEIEDHDAALRGYVKPEDDKFLTLDTIIQELQNGPISPDYSRYPKDVQDFALAVLAVINNQHWWSHCRTCFKTSRRTTSANLCRYAFPKDRHKKTSFVDYAVFLTRLAAHEYINAFNPIIMSTFRCNHDILFLVGGPEMSEIVYYVTKYATKNQHDVEAKIAYALAAMDRRREREKAEMEQRPLTDAEVARKRIQSLMYNMTNRHEIAGPMASLYLLRGNVMYTNFTFSNIPLRHMLREIEAPLHGAYQIPLISNTVTIQQRTVDELSDPTTNNDDDFIDPTSSFFDTNDISNIQEERTERVLVPVKHLSNYVYRPRELEKLSIYEFYTLYYITKRTATTPPERCFQIGHPLASTHALSKRRKANIPVINGPRLPHYATIATDHDSNELEYEEYSKIALVLFKPFRTSTDLLISTDGVETTWHTSYKSWFTSSPQNGGCSSFCHQIINNMQDYHYGCRLAQQAAREKKEQLQKENEDIDATFAEDEIRARPEDYDEDDIDQINQNEQNLENYASDFIDDSHLWVNTNNEIDEIVVANANDLHPLRFPSNAAIPVALENRLDSIADHDLLRGAAKSTTSIYKLMVNTGVSNNLATTSYNMDQLITYQRSDLTRVFRNVSITALRLWQKNAIKTTTNEPNSHNNAPHIEELDEDAQVMTPEQETTQSTIKDAVVQIQKAIDSPASRIYRQRIANNRGDILSIEPFASIADVSYAFALNKKQFIAFSEVASSLLKSWKAMEAQDTTATPAELNLALLSRQLLLCVTGEGGTGKTRIIDAIAAFCRSWSRTDSVAKCALTGSAACSIDGITLDRFIGHQYLRNETTTFTKQGGSAELFLVIIDECSMMTPINLNRLHTYLSSKAQVKY